MGHAAYERGSAAIRAQIDREIKARPLAVEGFLRDHAMRAVLRFVEKKLERAADKWRA